jgi:hypothetical protein
VGPSTSEEFNTARLRLIPIACWKIEDILFAFDSSFVTPDVTREIRQLQALREKHKSKNSVSGKIQYPPLSVFGHADPVGPAVDPDGYNKALSGRRATAVYALLIVNSEPDKAVSLWRQVSATENWGAQQQQTMRDNVPAGTSDSDLIKTYLQTLCPSDFQLTLQDFLAQGADSAGKGDYQGCSSFNPLLLFSQPEEDQFVQAKQNNDQAGIEARNAANAPNRRVLVLLFRPGSLIVPVKWPCPPATGDKTGCIKRFWSNGDARRHTLLPDAERKFEDTHDTFACRFYQRLLNNSPCEQILRSFEIRLYDPRGRFIADAPFSYVVGQQDPVTGTASSEGIVTVSDVEVPQRCHIQWGYKPDEGQEPILVFDLDMYLTIDSASREQEATEKLHNLGYPDENELTENITRFQEDYGDLNDPPLTADGVLDDATLKLIRDTYQACEDDLRKDKPSQAQGS